MSSSFCTMIAFIPALRSTSSSTWTAAMQLHARMYRSVSSTRMPVLMFLYIHASTKFPTVPRLKRSRSGIKLAFRKKKHTGGTKKKSQDKTGAAVGHVFAPLRRYQLKNCLHAAMIECVSEPRMVAVVVCFSLLRPAMVVGVPRIR